ncbi:Two-component signal transduction system YycFG, regulatory protein YycI [Marininema mesophilum]|uniref:Two-component signal transduction system YycFG, regulatory protein YycI n=1 Tax=Marininema mesophilum TaxID=1048340 RepID=A0A1H3AID3_9BACL|nr:two-component system regulatory protein YycI [Marininema mesophilum]SDX29480.1 Two-component signal transduction system YycFG, regulatory protein YycI [Marininema mesophilum]
MEWSKAKSILIMAFLALNIFLASQLFNARTEQSQDDQATNTQEELNEIATEADITILGKTPAEPPQVNSLKGSPVSFKEPWTNDTDGTWVQTFDPPLTVSGDREKTLNRYIDSLDNYVFQPDESNDKRQVYYQRYGKNLIFDGKIEAKWKNKNHLTSLRQSLFKVESQNGAKRPGVAATTTLINLIEKGQIQKKETVTNIQLGYHSQSYDKKVRILQPMWRIQTKKHTFFVNAFNGAIESSVNETNHE